MTSERTQLRDKMWSIHCDVDGRADYAFPIPSEFSVQLTVGLYDLFHWQAVYPMRTLTDRELGEDRDD